MGQSASIALVTSAELDKVLQNRPNLKPGDKIEGKVVKLRSDGKAVIDFGKFQAAVELKVEVKEGEILRFQVVERGKQLKLKLEHPGEKVPQEVKNLIKQADLQQEKAIEELQSKIDQLLQKEANRPETTESNKRVDHFLKDIKSELGKIKEHIQIQEDRDPLPREVKREVENLLKNLDQALKKLPEGDAAKASQRLETLARAVQNLRTSLDANREDRDMSEIRDHLVKQVSQLKSEVENSNIDSAVKKDVEAIIAKLSEAAEKIAQLKSPEQLPELRRVVSEDIKPHLAKLQEIMNRQEVPAGTDKYQAVEEIKSRVENLQKDVEIILEKSPPSSKDIDALLKTVEKALSEVSESDRRAMNLQKDIGSELIKLKEQFLVLERKEALPGETKSEAEYLLKNAANVLRRVPTAESDTAEYAEKLEVLKKAVSNLRSYTESTREFHEMREDIVKQVSQLKSQLEDSGIPVKKEVEVLVARLSAAAEKIGQLKSPEQQAEVQRIISHEIKPDLTALQQALDQEVVIKGTEKYRMVEELTRRVENLQKDVDTTLQKLSAVTAQDNQVLLKEVDSALGKLADVLDMSRFSRVRDVQVNRQPPPDSSIVTEALQKDISNEISKIREHVQGEQVQKQEIESLMQRVGEAVKQLPDTPEARESLENLARAVKNLRTSLETGREFQELREQIVKQVDQLKSQLENLNLDAPAKKEVEAIIDKLARAAEKAAQLKGPEQLPELRQVINNEIKPQLSALNDVLGKETPAPTTPDYQQIQEVKNQVENLQRDMDTALKKLPAEVPKEIEPLLKDVEAALSKVSDLSALADTGSPQFSESIQTIYDNIKTALRLLQANLQVSGNKLELPEEIRQIFQNLQSDLKLSEVTENISQQLSQLKTLVENAGLPYEKVAKEVVNSLNEMLARLNELKTSGKTQELQSFIQDQLKPFLKSLGDIFTNPRLVGEMDNPQKLVQIAQTIRSLQTGVENMLARGMEPSTELSQLAELSERLTNLPPEVKSALSQSPASQRVSESIANLARNIEILLSGLPDKLPEAVSANGTAGTGGANEADSAALTAKIRTLLSGLKSHFEPLDIGQNALKLVPRLKSLLEDSGIFFEKKLNDIIGKLAEASDRLRSVQTLDQLPEIRNIIEKDLKPNLMQLREYLNNEKIASQLGEQKTLESIRNTVDDLLSNISNQQSRAVEQQTQQNPVQVFSFHIPIKGEENPAELKVFYNRGRKKDSPEEYKLSLFLDMDRIGEIRSDFFQLKEDLTITFYVKDDSIKEYFDEHVHELEESLGPVFESVNLNVIVSSKKIAAFETEDLEQEIISDKAVNVKA